MKNVDEKPKVKMYEINMQNVGEELYKHIYNAVAYSKDCFDEDTEAYKTMKKYLEILGKSLGYASKAAKGLRNCNSEQLKEFMEMFKEYTADNNAAFKSLMKKSEYSDYVINWNEYYQETCKRWEYSMNLISEQIIFLKERETILDDVGTEIFTNFKLAVTYNRNCFRRATLRHKNMNSFIESINDADRILHHKPLKEANHNQIKQVIEVFSAYTENDNELFNSLMKKSGGSKFYNNWVEYHSNICEKWVYCIAELLKQLKILSENEIKKENMTNQMKMNWK